MSTVPGTPSARERLARAGAVHRRVLHATAIDAVLIGSSATAPVSGASASPPQALPAHASTGSAARSTRPNKADWEKIQTAAGLRTIALAPHRTARFRAFAAYLGLSELVSIHPFAPGLCATAVTYLYDNLLDLESAYPGENWTALRQAVAKEPSIHACAPRRQHDARPQVADHQASADRAAHKTSRRVRAGRSEPLGAMSIANAGEAAPAFPVAEITGKTTTATHQEER
jgi:hypothetical protein